MSSTPETDDKKLSKPVVFKGHLEIYLQVNPDGSYKLETGFKNVLNEQIIDLLSMATMRSLLDLYIDGFNEAVVQHQDNQEKLDSVLQDKSMIVYMNELMGAMEDRFINFMLSIALKELESRTQVEILPGNLKIVP